MYGDIQHFVRNCLTWRSWSEMLSTSAEHASWCPVDRVGVDIIEMPQTEKGSIIVFIDYLTKWVEACATED